MNGTSGASGVAARTCDAPGCGNPLDGKRGDARYCSDGCRSAGWRKSRQDELGRLEREIHRLVTRAFDRARGVYGENG